MELNTTKKISNADESTSSLLHGTAPLPTKTAEQSAEDLLYNLEVTSPSRTQSPTTQEEETDYLGLALEGLQIGAVGAVTALSLPILLELGIPIGLATVGSAVIGTGYSATTNLASAGADVAVNGTAPGEALNKVSAKQEQDTKKVYTIALSQGAGFVQAGRVASLALVEASGLGSGAVTGATAGVVSSLTAGTLQMIDARVQAEKIFEAEYGQIPLTAEARQRLFYSYLKDSSVDASGAVESVGKHALIGLVGGAVGGQLSAVATTQSTAASSFAASLGDTATAMALYAAQGELTMSGVSSMALSGFIGYQSNRRAGLSLRANAARHELLKTLRGKDFPDPEEQRLLLAEAKSQDTRIPVEAVRQFSPPKVKDQVTKFYGPEDRLFTAQRALEFSKQTGVPVSWVDVDIADLGGLSAFLGRARADVVFEGIAQTMLHDLKRSVHGVDSKIIPFRYGGDEFGFLIVGAKAENLLGTLKASADKVAKQLSEYSNGDGQRIRLDRLENLKHSDDPLFAGVGVRYSATDLDQSVAMTMQRGSDAVEVAKQTPLNPGLKKEEIELIPPELRNQQPQPPDWNRIRHSQDLEINYSANLPILARSHTRFLTQEQIKALADQELSQQNALSMEQRLAVNGPFIRDTVTAYNAQLGHAQPLYQGLHLTRMQRLRGETSMVYHVVVDLHNFAAANKQFTPSGANQHFRSMADKYRELISETKQPADFSRGQGTRLEIATSGLPEKALLEINARFRQWFTSYSQEHGLDKLIYDKDPDNPNLQGVQPFISVLRIDPDLSAVEHYYKHELNIFEEKSRLK